MDKNRKRITDIPLEELRKDMAEFGRKYSSSVRSSRKFLRSLGMKIDNRGVMIR